MIAPPSNDPALAFFREIVEPTVAEFSATLDDKRRGCLVCLALASMTEHYFHARPALAANGLPAFRTKLYEENKFLRWIADVANATKHVERHNASKLRYSDVRSEEIGGVGMLRAGWPLGGEEIVVGHGGEWRLAELIEKAMAFWRDKLGS